MNLPETIYQRSLLLPENAAAEVLAFIELLERREQQTAGADAQRRQTALAHIAAAHIPWQGKPIPDRAALYDDARA
ncbi:MAG: hypothetical protein PHH59_11045 [Methylovulum sp.]|uniref:hypothetical protein n=1 Tax=Methylovulum sp. TaxID=1916980 RepID=UPI00260A2EEA|nr:hypothetical protein [Methylovulum sp.]MDD2724542.1 hypothetical protein [Methylovulum sp.]MDD5124027.1 hypothetical protein [Methylovulum sp.]